MLTQAQYQSKLDSQSAIARKVLTIVPIQEAWTRQQIHTELHRSTQASIEGRTVDGCLRALTESGLVREHPANHFTQVRPHEKAPKVEGGQAKSIMEHVEAPPTGTEILARQEAHGHKPAFSLIDTDPAPLPSLQRMEHLADRLIETAAELDSIRKQVDAELEAAKAKTVKLDQLTALLDSLRP